MTEFIGQPVRGTIAPPPAGAPGDPADGAGVAGRAPGGGRAGWHRRASALPLAYLAGLVVLALAHPFLPSWRWLAVHLLLLGAVTNAIVVWSAHFTSAVLRVPAPRTRRREAARLATLNAGVVVVLTGGGAGLPWLGVGGAALVFGAVTAHLGWLAARLRAALPARFGVTVGYYLAAAAALLSGIPVGAWMLVSHGAARDRLLLFHAHVNLLGWVALTVLGTVLTLWPTVLRTRMVDGAVRAARLALPVAVTGLVLLGTGLLGWWPPVFLPGLLLVAAAVVIVAGPAVRTARTRPPSSFAAWSIAAAGGWLLVALVVDGWVLLSAGGDPAVAAGGFGAVLVPLLAGFAAQVLVGALSYLLPMALGGGPAVVRHRLATMDRHWAQRVTMANAALVGFLLPASPYVRITTSLLVLVALGQFLLPAVRVLRGARR